MNGLLPLFLGLTTLAAPSAPTAQTEQAPSVGSYYESTPEDLARINVKPTPYATEATAGVTVTVNLIYKDGDYTAKSFYIYNEDTFLGGRVSDYESDGHTIVLEDIAPGTYTVMGAFEEKKSHPGTAWTPCYVFNEDVKIEGNTQVDVDASTAVNQFIGASYMPDGELARLDNNGYDENFHSVFIPGNCLDKLIQTTIYDTKYDAWIVSAIIGTGSYDMDNVYGPGIHWRLEEKGNILVNDISDRFLICQQRDNYTDDEMISTVAYSRGLSNLDLSNDISNYRSIEESFAHTPAFYAYGSPDEKYQFTCLGYDGWVYFPYTILPWKITSPYAMSYSTSANASDFSDFHPYYRFELYDAMVGWDEFYLKGQRFIFDDEGAVYVFSNFYAQPNVSGTRAVDAEGNEVYYEFPGHPGLQLKASQTSGYTYGNCAPINVVSPVIYKIDDIFFTNINPSFRGLLGEDRDADKIGLDMSATHDGEEGNVDGENWNAYWSMTPNDTPEGVYEAMINNTNVIVNDMPGYNNTTLRFSYEGEDACPPSLQAIQLRTADGYFGQTFASPDDVRIIICAGDYDWTETPEYLEYNYASKPVTVKAEVAPSAADSKTWTEIPLTNRQDYNNLAGYGYFFEGSLADTELSASQGWFDVRITITDEAGNSNIQQFGPVFNVGLSAGINDATIAGDNGLLRYADGKITTVDGSSADITVYSIDGCSVAGVRGSSLDINDLNPGLYIVSGRRGATLSSFKIVVK